MPIAIADSAAPRVEGEFVLQGAAAPDEMQYALRIVRLFDRLDADEQADAAAEKSGAKVKASATRKRRNDLVKKLREVALDAIAAKRTFEAAQNASVVAYGRYVEACESIRGGIFNVDVRPGSGGGKETFRIEVAAAPYPDSPQPDTAERELFVAIGETSSVLDRILGKSKDRLFQTKAAIEAAEANHSYYMRKLGGVAQVGLEGGRPIMGALALQDLRSEVVRSAAPEIKNQHMRALGVWCFLFVAACLFLYAAAHYGWPPFCTAKSCQGGSSYLLFSDSFWPERRAFFLLAAGSCVGAWASFAIRNPTLSFGQLANPDDGLLRPALRVLFVMALACLVGLLFWTGVVSFKLGALDTAAFRTNGSIAVLIGAFCGLAERALSTSLLGQAEAFGGRAGTVSVN